ncbi:MAG: NAD(P)/FAD-dependent oxidoreductase [Gammaproteobacteria bacterium]|nr:NAD(P)/FAD-dependent oxidoreductase [Gammaproteobacteria bacterium]
MEDSVKKIIIAGAGPAGLTLAYEVLEHRKDQNIVPHLIEQDTQVGGISKTVNYKGNRMDIGGHRFFSKSDWVMDWWASHIDYDFDKPEQITYQNKNRMVGNSDVELLPQDDEKQIGQADAGQNGKMLLRNRLSRIYYLRKFFDYPVSLSLETIRNLGIYRMMLIGFSYVRARVLPIRKEENLEDFLINRFGTRLYKTFFKDYTEKVWGVECHNISAEWGAQRIKGLSIIEAIRHALFSRFKSSSFRQKDVNTSLIERFLYPQFGPGQMWEVVTRKIKDRGGLVDMQTRVTDLDIDYAAKKITRVQTYNLITEEYAWHDCQYFVSTMPIKFLVRMFDQAPDDVKRVAEGLMYRDFITLGVLLKKLKKSKYTDDSDVNMLPDNWIYIQEPDVRLGRLQIFNNWSPYLVADDNTVWLGLEYFCNEEDDLWTMSEAEITELAIAELESIGLIDSADVLDHTVHKVEKTYPAYFGTYDEFHKIREYLDGFDNLFPVGRNGMHRYNNQDHSMLTARYSAEAIISGRIDRDKIWDVNVDDDYHEEK